METKKHHYQYHGTIILQSGIVQSIPEVWMNGVLDDVAAEEGDS